MTEPDHDAADVDRSGYWDKVYATKEPTDVSWFQKDPQVSMDLIRASGVSLADPIIDMGGGSSMLVDRLLADGYTDLTVVDVSAQALAASRTRLGEDATKVRWLARDLLAWSPDRRYRLWHDRAVFHFLTGARERARYLAAATEALLDGGVLIVATFAADGPTMCSGLPVARYSPDELAAQFPGFVAQHARREEHRTPAGGIQPFTWLMLRAQFPG